MANRIIKLYKNYFSEFYLKQPENVRRKINFCLDIVRLEDRISQKFLRNINGVDGLFEIRVEYAGNIYRIFCCFDKGALVILFNAFQKKTMKTPKKEILIAKQLMEEYFNEKKDDE